MAHLKDVMAYFIQKYPANMQSELSKARLTKMVYLADWYQALHHGRQITTIQWYFDNYGPFVHDIEVTASSNPSIFRSAIGKNIYGQPKQTFSLADQEYRPIIPNDERPSLDHIVKVTRELYWNAFIKLVYSTHPIASSERYSFLNLIDKATDYRAMRRLTA